MPDREPVKAKLLAGMSVSEVGGFGKIGAAFDYMLFGSSAGSTEAP